MAMKAWSSTGLPTVKTASLRGSILLSLVILLLIFWGGFFSAIPGEDQIDSDFPDPLLGVRLLLRKAVERASSRCTTLKKKRVSPHVDRHGTAMALLQSGVDIAVIALWLGHESIETTNVYIHANLAIKEKALAKVAPIGRRFRRFRANDHLLAFLESL
jgi:integrase